MGMIPIALAIAGFVLLWVIVNYHSLSTRRTNIAALQSAREQLFHTYIRLAKQLSALMLVYGIHMPAYLVNLANEPGQKIDKARLTTSYEQIKLKARNQADLQSNQDYNDLMQQIELATAQLLRNQQRLLAEKNAYNQQVTRMPYRIVAQLFGFKPIDVHVQ